jgi:hypothetical protein
VITGLVFLGVVGQIIDPDGTRARIKATDAKQQQYASQPQKAQTYQKVETEGVTAKPVASSFSNLLTVDNIRLGHLPQDTLAYVTVRIPTKSSM